MNATCRKLLVQMVISVMAGENELLWELYEGFIKENRLHVPVEEILRAKREASA